MNQLVPLAESTGWRFNQLVGWPEPVGSMAI